jgi:hypothetical protein
MRVDIAHALAPGTRRPYSRRPLDRLLSVVCPGFDQVEQTPVILEETFLTRANVFDLAAHTWSGAITRPDAQDK